MHELRLVAVSEDGSYVVLAQPGRGTRFSLPNDERLRAVVRGQFSRLAQYEIEVESPLRPKEIQARIRAGETAEQIADAAGVPIERVRWFEGPVLAERAYMAQQAQAASVRRPSDSGPGPRLGEIVAERLRLLGADPDEAQWDSRKQGDGSWLVEMTSEAGGEPLRAAWIFDSRRRHAAPEDDNAARLSLPEDALESAGLPVQPSVRVRGLGTVTPFVPRSSPAAPLPTASDGSRALRPTAQDASRAYPAGTPDASGARRPVPLAGGQSSTSDQPQAHPRAPGGQPPAPRGPAQPSRPPAQPPAAPAAGASRPGVSRPAAAAGGPATQPPADPATAEAEPGQERTARTRPTRKAAGGRGRRASVPTWDEIMFGSSRPQE